MKKSRKFAAFVASILAVACMAAPMATSFSADAAATPGEVTFAGEVTGTHAYTAYKIFSGDADANGLNPVDTNVELKNINWAAGVDGDAVIAALKADSRFGAEEANVFKACTTAASVATVLKTYTHNSDGAKNFADFAAEKAETLKFPATKGSEGKITLGEDGYYVIVETDLTPDENGDGSMTSYLLGVYDKDKGAEVTVKAAIPTFVKKIKDENTSAIEDDGTNGEWQDSADYDINDTVPFQLTATLPTNYEDYDTYKLVFHDDLQKDVFTFNSSSVKVYYQKGDNEPVAITEGFTLVTEGLSENGVFASTKTDKTEDFTLTFNDLMTVAEDVTAGDKIIVEYNATLTENANIGSAGNWNSAYLEYSNNPEYSGSGENSPTSHTKEDLNVAFTYEVDVNKVDGLNDPLTGAGFTLYKWNASAEGDDKYEAVGTEIKGEDLTTFIFKGIDAGKYKLVETTTPDGYNTAADLEFIVKASHDETADVPTLKTLKVVDTKGADLATGQDAKFSVDLTNGKLDTTVVNTSGSTLPSTGGIGTTIFYVAGGVLVVGAGVLLVSKKRMSNK